MASSAVRASAFRWRISSAVSWTALPRSSNDRREAAVAGAVAMVISSLGTGRRRSRASGPMVISARSVDPDPHLGFQRLDAESDEFSTRQPLSEALVIELVFVRGEAQQVIAPVGHPLPRTLGPEPGQIPFERPQGLLPQVGVLLCGHGSPSPTFGAGPVQAPRSSILPGDSSQRIESAARPPDPCERVGREAAVEQLGKRPLETIAVAEPSRVEPRRKRQGTDASAMRNG